MRERIHAGTLPERADGLDVGLPTAGVSSPPLKALAGKLVRPAPPPEHFAEHIDEFRYELLPVHQRHVAALPELPAIHGDPFDRMLVA